MSWWECVLNVFHKECLKNYKQEALVHLKYFLELGIMGISLTCPVIGGLVQHFTPRIWLTIKVHLFILLNRFLSLLWCMTTLYLSPLLILFQNPQLGKFALTMLKVLLMIKWRSLEEAIISDILFNGNVVMKATIHGWLEISPRSWHQAFLSYMKVTPQGHTRQGRVLPTSGELMRTSSLIILDPEQTRPYIPSDHPRHQRRSPARY